MRTLVISAFPVSGKTYMYSNYNGDPYIILDAELSKFKWMKNTKGQLTDDINPEFPSNYIDYIKENIGKVDVIFVGSDKEVRDLLISNNIKYFLVYPNKSMKKTWLNRMRLRGNTSNLISFIIDNFDDFIDEIDKENQSRFVYKLKLSDEKSYIDNDMIRYLDSNKECIEYINNSIFDLVKKYKRTDINKLAQLKDDIDKSYVEAVVNRSPVTLSTKNVKDVLSVIKSIINLYRREK